MDGRAWPNVGDWVEWVSKKIHWDMVGERAKVVSTDYAGGLWTFTVEMTQAQHDKTISSMGNLWGNVPDGWRIVTPVTKPDPEWGEEAL